jgi:hypothetical protein
MSTFNAEQFASTSTSDAFDTKIIPVPDGPHRAQVVKLDYRTLEAKDNNPERTIMEISWAVTDDKIKKLTGMELPTAKQSIWLDLTPEGGLDKGAGKNVALGQVREALGQNKPGKPWSPSHIMNGMATILVKGEKDKQNPDITYARVTRVSKATS